MRSNNRDSSAVLKNDFAVPERTVVDAKVPAHHGAPLARRPKATPAQVPASPPANVIPFTKPRALANAHPNNVVVSAPLHLDDGPTVPQRNPPRGTVPPAMPVPAARQPVVTAPPAAPTIAIAPAPAPVAPVAPAPAPIAAAPMGLAPNLPPPPIAATTPPPAATKYDPNKWAIYDKLGLGKPKINAAALNKWIVSAYRLLGFVILTIIVVVLVGYIAQQAYFALSDSWVVPNAVSVSDERVVSLQAQVAEQQNARDKIADELNQAERTIASQQAFQAEFAKAIKTDLEGRKVALGKIQALASAAASTRAEIRAQSAAYAASSNRRMAEEYKAGLIDRNSMLSGKFQVAQITSSNLSLAERQAEYETRAAELSQNAKGLDALLTTAGGDDAALSYEVLRIKQEYEASKLDLAKSVENRNTLKASLERQDKLIAGLQNNALLRAVTDKATVAFVPYAGLSGAKKGASLYACKVGMLVCHKVGEILEVLPGEVQFKHPHKDKQLRGQMIEMKLDADDAGAAEDDVLFVGGKPLFI